MMSSLRQSPLLFTCRRSALQYGRRLSGYHTTVIAPQSKLNKLFERMMWLDVIEITMLNHEIKKRLGLNFRSSGSPRSSGGDSTNEAESAVVDVKTSFDLKLIGFDPNAKIKVIKEVRAISGLGLKEAKELVEGAPKVIQKGLKEDVANELKAKLEEIGAVIEVS